MRYRADIDGLRAIAVLAVLLFHAKSRVFSGGFVGVDVFFVISGFLITQLILPEVRQGTFSVGRFYERRIRRIFPALFAMLVVCGVLATWLLLPSDLEAFGRSLFATTVFGSNVLFYSESGYFDAPAAVKPLLHTWSLAVEEQFYILFPVFLLAIRKYLRGRYLVWSLLVVLGTFTLNVWGVSYDQSATFYLAPARAWEIGLGALLAMEVVKPSTSQLVRHLAGVLGLMMVGYSVTAFSSLTPFPGIAAALPCLGTVLIVWAGGGGPNLAGRLLSIRPLVLIGLISYSLYLWHWPLLVFVEYQAMRQLTVGETVVTLAVAAVAAAVSWRFVERPFRAKKNWLSRRLIFVMAGSVMAVVGGAGVAGWMLKGLPTRLGPSDREFVARAFASGVAAQPCGEISLENLANDNLCHIGATNASEPRFFLWGDSHGRAVAGAVSSAAARHGVAVLAAIRSGCPPLVGLWQVNRESRQRCGPYTRAVLDFVARDPQIESVLLAGRWAVFAEGTRYGREPGDPIYLADALSRSTSVYENERVFQRGLSRTVEALEALHKRVWILASVPEVGWDVPSVLSRARLWNVAVDVEPTLEDYRLRQSFVLDTLAQLNQPGLVDVLYPSSILCGSGTCQVTHEGRVLYLDDDHLSAAGGELIAPLFDDVFAASEEAGWQE